MKTHRPVDKRRRAPVARKVREFVGGHEIHPLEAWVIKDAGRTLAALFGKDVMQKTLREATRKLKSEV